MWRCHRHVLCGIVSCGTIAITAWPREGGGMVSPLTDVIVLLLSYRSCCTAAVLTRQSCLSVWVTLHRQIASLRVPLGTDLYHVYGRTVCSSHTRCFMLHATLIGRRCLPPALVLFALTHAHNSTTACILYEYKLRYSSIYVSTALVCSREFFRYVLLYRHTCTPTAVPPQLTQDTTGPPSTNIFDF